MLEMSVGKAQEEVLTDAGYLDRLLTYSRIADDIPRSGLLKKQFN